MISHFESEEAYIFPLLEAENKLLKRALREYGRLKSLFSSSNKIEINLSFIEEELVAYIRFEERVLFKEVERMATEEQLKIIEKDYKKQP